MKRTLTALTAVIFAGAMALPAFAQMGMNSNPASSTSSSSTSESSSNYRRVEPGPTTNSIEHTERDYKSERSDVSSEAQPPAQAHSRVERKESTSTTTEAAPPPPPVESSTTTTTTHRTETGY